MAWRNRSFGSALEFAWSTDGEYAVRESTSKIKIFSKTFQVCLLCFWNFVIVQHQKEFRKIYSYSGEWFLMIHHTLYKEVEILSEHLGFPPSLLKPEFLFFFFLNILMGGCCWFDPAPLMLLFYFLSYDCKCILILVYGALGDLILVATAKISSLDFRDSFFMEFSCFRKRRVFGQPFQLSVYMVEHYWQCAPMILFVSMIGLNAG